MITGFYRLEHLDTKTLKKFYKDVLMMSYLVLLESKYTDKHPSRRGSDNKYTISDFLRMVSSKNHNTCVDRSIQHRFTNSDGSIEIMPDCDKGEIGFKLHMGLDKEWHQISFYVTLDNLKMLTEKYNLIMS